MLTIIIINPIPIYSNTTQIYYHFHLAALQNYRLLFPSKISYTLDSKVLILHPIRKEKESKHTPINNLIYKAGTHTIAVLMCTLQNIHKNILKHETKMNK